MLWRLKQIGMVHSLKALIISTAESFPNQTPELFVMRLNPVSLCCDCHCSGVHVSYQDLFWEEGGRVKTCWLVTIHICLQ